MIANLINLGFGLTLKQNKTFWVSGFDLQNLRTAKKKKNQNRNKKAYFHILGIFTLFCTDVAVFPELSKYFDENNIIVPDRTNGQNYNIRI